MKVKQLLTRTAGALGVTTGLLFVGSPLMAQVKIGDNPNSINPSSILELESATRALLLPRVALQGLGTKAPVDNAVAGMHVYNTATVAGDNGISPGEYYYDGNRWVRLVSEISPDRYQYENGPAPATGGCTEGNIWVDVLEGSATEGQQWICRNGAWDPYSAPASTPFYSGLTTTSDAGSNKTGLISRRGQIVALRENNLGKTLISPGGILQLYRSPTLGANAGGAIDFTNTSTQLNQFRIGVRNDAAGDEGALAFQTGSGSSNVMRMVMNKNGQIGIGTSTPARPLHVAGVIFSGAENATGNGLVAGTSGTNGTMLVYAPSDNDRAQIINQASGENANMILARKGSASGENFVEFVIGNQPNPIGSISRTGTGVSYNLTSDRRLKENIKNTHYSIEDLMKVGVVDYNYINDETKTQITGFIAQDLFKVFPDAVTKGSDDVSKKPWMVDYGKITPLLVKAVQDQQKEIAALKVQLSEMNALKAEVASIKAMLGNAEQQKSEAIISK
ncbi:tail fiber domain-containing protein [Dyadobacter sp. BHUBP1]|uniref:tail fiber domain-containing protein n=1 Tax=Dyadobacter sp. BHUBP1 TaxID=3424178 RepID=UPI003D32B062